MTAGERRPLDAVLDLVLYAPVGFATSSRELLPELVSKGRQQVDSQVRLARMLGQFAVAYGKVEARKRIQHALSGGGAAPATRAAPAAARVPAPAGKPTAPGSRNGAAPTTSRPQSARAPRPPDEEVVPVHRRGAAHGEAVPAATDLAIPGYDALAASQVVARLEGLTTLELEQVRHYEQSNRNRRTVLGKIAQLEGTRH